MPEPADPRGGSSAAASLLPPPQPQPLADLAWDGLPASVTVFTPEGAVAFQNAASRTYLGDMSDPALMPADRQALAVLLHPSAPTPLLAAHGCNEEGQQPLQTSPPLGRVAGGLEEEGTGGTTSRGTSPRGGDDDDVLSALFALDPSKLAQMLGATQLLGPTVSPCAWEGIVRVPVLLNPSRPPSSRSRSLGAGCGAARPALNAPGRPSFPNADAHLGAGDGVTGAAFVRLRSTTQGQQASAAEQDPSPSRGCCPAPGVAGGSAGGQGSDGPGDITPELSASARAPGGVAAAYPDVSPARTQTFSFFRRSLSTGGTPGPDGHPSHSRLELGAGLDPQSISHETTLGRGRQPGGLRKCVGAVSEGPGVCSAGERDAVPAPVLHGLKAAYMSCTGSREGSGVALLAASGPARVARRGPSVRSMLPVDVPAVDLLGGAEVEFGGLWGMGSSGGLRSSKQRRYAHRLSSTQRFTSISPMATSTWGLLMQGQEPSGEAVSVGPRAASFQLSAADSTAGTAAFLFQTLEATDYGGAGAGARLPATYLEEHLSSSQALVSVGGREPDDGGGAAAVERPRSEEAQLACSDSNPAGGLGSGSGSARAPASGVADPAGPGVGPSQDLSSCSDKLGPLLSRVGTLVCG
ncbi:hypothetical protein HYH03_014519 [Edaphochlamys debaryana]|uniref:Uncharacterized protein n=1 Tax=Edaphochlamys debaryana TaxID=47281 RepID=A0A836BRW0_9CHLO|nr:hypothetical protein HYH03_014519 [Edaphochlamys debaryana]|eukprot:KAG2486836.1 hypothetical protein HYH03_014519 [Edaphochlamys debaryana]